MEQRRNAFILDPKPPVERHPVPKMGARAAERVKPSVDRATAEIAAHLAQNPVFVDLVAMLRKEVVDALCASPLGAAGTEAREVARYELAALANIENRISAIGSEFSLHTRDDDLPR